MDGGPMIGVVGCFSINGIHLHSDQISWEIYIPSTSINLFHLSSKHTYLSIRKWVPVILIPTEDNNDNSKYFFQNDMAHKLVWYHEMYIFKCLGFFSPTQKTSYTSSPTSSRVETFRLGSRTRAINATHRPIPRATSRN